VKGLKSIDFLMHETLENNFWRYATFCFIHTKMFSQTFTTCFPTTTCLYISHYDIWLILFFSMDQAISYLAEKGTVRCNKIFTL